MCKIISDSLEELDKLVEAYPRCIPLAAAAEFLGIAPETLRTSISQGKCSFGIGWTSDKSRGYHQTPRPAGCFSGSRKLPESAAKTGRWLHRNRFFAPWDLHDRQRRRKSASPAAEL